MEVDGDEDREMEILYIYKKKVVKKRKAGKASVALSTFPRYQNFYNG